MADDQKLQRHEFWRKKYRERRYARHLSQIELNRRIRDVFLNLLILTPEAKIGPPPITEEFAIWMEKWTHVLEEMKLRYGPYPAGFTRDIFSEPLPNFVSALGTKAANTLSALHLKEGDVFVKFGKSKYMERLFERGALRIQPASFFSERDHNGAIRDDELTLALSFALSRDDVVKLVVNPQDVPQKINEQRFDIKLQSTTDYWLYCVSSSVEPRLFVDFDADACVIVRGRQKFSCMLREAARFALPNAVLREGHAIYVDPLMPKSASDLFVPFCKRFGYSYQREYRFCWLPSAPSKKLCHVDVEIGSLKDIAEFVVL